MQWNLKEFFKDENELLKFIEQTKTKALNFNQTYKDKLSK